MRLYLLSFLSLLVPDQLLVLLGWLGLLLDEQTSSVVLDETGQSSFVEVGKRPSFSSFLSYFFLFLLQT